MKKMFKRILCTVMMLSLVMTVMPASHLAFAAEDLLFMNADFDALPDGAKGGLTSSEFYHQAYDYSNGTATGHNTEVTQLASGGTSGSGVSTAIAAAGYGRSGKAFFYNMTDVAANTENKLDFKWMPVIYSTDSYGRENIQVTYEFSIRTPENTGNGYQQYDIMLPFGGGYNTLVSLQAKTNGVKTFYAYDKTDGNTWRSMCTWEPGHWYNIAVVFTPGTNKLDYYLNGELVYNGIYSKSYDVVGGRFRLYHKVHTVTENTTYTDTLAIDDIRAYIGTPDTASFSTAVSSSAYRVNGDTIYLGAKSAEHDAFVNGLSVSGGGSVEVYTDGTYSAVAQTVTPGCKVVATSANGRVLGYYTVVEKENILICDMESSSEIGTNKVPAFEGTISSIGFAGSFADFATGTVEGAGSGKDGYAYFFDVNNPGDADGAPAMDFKFIPDITSGKATFEISMLAPSSYNTIRPSLYIPYNGSYKVMFAFDPDGKLSVNNAYIRQWIPGRWYNFAAEFTVGSGKADFYVNGELVLDDADVWSSLDSNGVISLVGGRMRFETTAYAGTSDVTAFDDVKVYTGGYDAETNAVEFASGSDEYEISEYGFVFAPESSVRVNTLKNYISGNFAVYEDDTFETTASYTGEDNVFVVTSENGNIVKYYNLVPDGTIAININGSATTKLSSRETVTVGAMARCENAKVFVASYDAEGNFIGADVTGASRNSDHAHVSFSTTNGEYVKAMLWDSTTLKPVGDMVIIQK